MIIEPQKTTLSYRCPACGYVATGYLEVFSLSGDLFKLKCSCHGSELIIQKTKEDSFRLTVPCFACPRPHDYIISKNVFFNSEIFVIPCSLSGFDICFIGKESLVEKEVERANHELGEILGDFAIENMRKTKEEFEFNDAQILDIVSYTISELCEESAIHCSCPPNEGDYTCEILNREVVVRCNKCGDSKCVPTTSVIEATEFLEADSLILDKN